MVELLLNYGANIDSPNRVTICFFFRGCCYCWLCFFQEGYTPLMEAASGGNAQIVELLLKAGADVNVYIRVSSLLLTIYIKQTLNSPSHSFVVFCFVSVIVVVGVGSQLLLFLCLYLVVVVAVVIVDEDLMFACLICCDSMCS